LVLKPVGCAPEHTWVCEVFAAWVCDEVRVPEPVRPRGGADAGWSSEGWGAHVFVPGRDADLTRELPLVKHVSDASHNAVAHLPRPAFLDARDDPWAFGDRLAWENAEPEGDAGTLEVIRRLQDALRPVESRSQVIQRRHPAERAREGRASAGRHRLAAVLQAGRHRQRSCYHRCGDLPQRALHLLDAWETGAEWNQLLVRALLSRLGPTGVFAARNRLMGSLVRHVERVRPVVDAILSRF
jgi:hypothetical protein